MNKLKKGKTEKGITLIALIITIVVLLILAVVTINAIKGDGIIQYAKKAQTDYTDAANKEQEDLNTLESQIGEAVNGGNKDEDTADSKVEITWKDNGDGTFTASNGTKVAIGDYVNYTYDTASAYSLSKTYSGDTINQTILQSTDLQWKVMGVNDRGELELISDKPTSASVRVKGATGYNNGVYIFNDVCKKQYSNQELGITARSLTIEDIEERYTEEGKSARNNYSGYGSTKTYGSGDNMYPTLYAEEALSGVTGSIREGGISESDSFYTSESALSVAYDSDENEVSTSEATASGKLMVTETYYYLQYPTTASYFDNSIFSDMIFLSESYWLASRYVHCSSSYVEFGFRSAGNYLSGGPVFKSPGYRTANVNYLRPVISLGSDIVLEVNDQNNSETNMWKISKK